MAIRMNEVKFRKLDSFLTTLAPKVRGEYRTVTATDINIYHMPADNLGRKWTNVLVAQTASAELGISISPSSIRTYYENGGIYIGNGSQPKPARRMEQEVDDDSPLLLGTYMVIQNKTSSRIDTLEAEQAAARKLAAERNAKHAHDIAVLQSQVAALLTRINTLTHEPTRGANNGSGEPVVEEREAIPPTCR